MTSKVLNIENIKEVNMNPIIRKCTCGSMAPSPASKVDDDGTCEYCADDASNSTRSMKI